MHPAANAIANRAFALPPPDATASSLAAAVTTLPTHNNRPPPGVGVDNPSSPGGSATPETTPTVVFVTMSTSTSTSSATLATGLPPSATDSGDNGECRLLGSFALFVQLALGGLALLSLVYKRWRERPQRPVKIWFFDVSKQVFGSVLVHMANVFMSMLTSGRFSIKLVPGVVKRGFLEAGVEMVRRATGEEGGAEGPNPCSFYLLNLAIDTTLGIPILIGLLRVYTAMVALTPLGKPRESIQSGNYGSPPNAWWWLKQSFIYFCGLFGMKLCVLIIFLAMPWISRVGDWALRWTEGDEKLQIIFVMMLFPLIMNAMQYYIIDSFIKMQGTGEAGDDEDDGADERRGPAYEGLVGSVSEDGEETDSEEEVEDRKTKAGPTVKLTPRGSSKDREYDPDVDGDSQTVIGSSSSRMAAERGTLLPKELYPRE